MSARSVGSAAKRVPQKPLKRKGVASKQDRLLVKNIMAEVPEPDVRAIARVLKRSVDVTKRLVEDVRQEFAESAKDYLAAHKGAVLSAVANTDDAKSLDAGIRGAQWALEHISFDGARVVDAPSKHPEGGTKVLIGVNLKLGGLVGPAAEPAVDAVDAVTVDPSHETN